MKTSKFLHKFLYMLIVSLVFVGCDSNDDDDMEMSAVELFLGDWAVTSAADMGGTRDQTAVFADLGTLSVGFADTDMYTLEFDYTDAAEDDVVLDGDYSVSESSTTVSLAVSLSGISAMLPFSYRFIDNDTVELTAEESIAATIGLLLGATLEGSTVLVLDRVG